MNNRTRSVVIRSFVHIMSLDKFRANCPYFSVGNCISYKEGKCKYKYHKCCSENFLCNRDDCKYGHGISVMKRIIVNKIYDEKYSIKDSVYETSENRCGMPMNCINKECELDHHLKYADRTFIYKFANILITDEEAWNEYEQLYCSSYSPGSDMMSSGSTIPNLSPIEDTRSPIIKSFASLLKDTSNSVACGPIEEPVDEMTVIMDEMLAIRKELAIKNKKVIDIKENIEKLRKELIITEEDLTNGRNRLRESAIKLSNS